MKLEAPDKLRIGIEAALCPPTGTVAVGAEEAGTEILGTKTPQIKAASLSPASSIFGFLVCELVQLFSTSDVRFFNPLNAASVYIRSKITSAYRSERIYTLAVISATGQTLPILWHA